MARSRKAAPPCVVGWSPRPNASPPSSRTTTRPSLLVVPPSGPSCQGRSTRKPRPREIGFQLCCTCTTQSRSSTGSGSRTGAVGRSKASRTIAPTIPKSASASKVALTVVLSQRGVPSCGVARRMARSSSGLPSLAAAEAEEAPRLSSSSMRASGSWDSSLILTSVLPPWEGAWLRLRIAGESRARPRGAPSAAAGGALPAHSVKAPPMRRQREASAETTTMASAPAGQAARCLRRT
mmetsp:Transcript_21581/g.68074  ORF Transcript_21581/g.68074 Transcript_21581/m.68074 type:complete len:237 (+) Transcript_21581:487-1197(+)